MLLPLLFRTMLVLAFAALALATPTYPHPHHHYRPPGPNDVRSPCPGLNSLANHGFLPRSGKNITVDRMVAGAKNGLNVGYDFAFPVSQLGSTSAPTGLTKTFDLDDLDEHNYPLEHDGSLSREDYYFGNDHSFNQTIFNQVLAFYGNDKYATIPVASRARYARIQNSLAINPTAVYGPRQIILSYGETALYLSAMGDPVHGHAPLNYVKTFFEEERLPYELGWRPPVKEITLQSLGNMIMKLFEANPEALPEGLTVGENSLKDVISLIDPITGKAENITCIIAGLC